MSLAAERVKWTTAATWLAFCGLNSALVYLLIFVLPYQLYQAYFVPLPHFYSFQNASPALWLTGWAILFQLYYIAYRLCPQRPSRAVMSLIICFPIFFSLILFWEYPIGANDIFDQIFRGHIIAHYGLDYFGTLPLHFTGDPLLQYAWWKHVPGVYGPLWEGLSGLTSWVVGNDLWPLVVAYKLLTMAHFWAGMPLVYSILKRIRPDYAARGLLLYAWNPTMQFEIPGNGHNDALVVFWLLVAVYTLVRGKHILALLAVTAATLVKFMPALLIPLFLVALWHAHAGKPLSYRLRQIGLAFAAMGTLTSLLLLPLGLSPLLASLSAVGNDFHSSISTIALYAVQNVTGIAETAAQQLIRNGFLLLLVGVVFWHTIRLLRGSPDAKQVRDEVLSRSYEILFVFLVIVSTSFRPWYLTWLIALVPFLRSRYAERTTLLGFTALGSYFIWFLRWPIGSPIAVDAEMMLALVIFPLPILFALGVWLYRQRSWATPGLTRSRSLAVEEPVPNQA